MGILKGGELYTALNVAAITDQLDTYVTAPAIFVDELTTPQDFTGTEFINFYLTSPVNPSIQYGEYTRSVNCHGATHKKSLSIALAVLDEINREPINNGRMYAEMLVTIPPSDDTDVYNTPVTVLIKADL